MVPEPPDQQQEEHGQQQQRQETTVSLTLVASLVATCLVLGLGGFRAFGTAYHGDNLCQMTYMYEQPQFIPVPVAAASAARSGHLKYRLFAYGEGAVAEVIREGRRPFSGIPVIFVPGNSGSHKQVRSLASVSLRRAVGPQDGGPSNSDGIFGPVRREAWDAAPVKFDFFSVDFGEEMSAIYGGVLEAQTAFTRDCVRTVLGLYASGGRDRRRQRPRSVVLVGHSLGGVVAKAAALELEETEVETVVTLATPHAAAVVTPDPFTAEFYRRLSAGGTVQNSSARPNLLTVSVAGGEKDLQVRTGLTAPPSGEPHHPAISVSTTAIPGAWVSTDHQCIVWCKQVVLALVRSLFDSVDPATGQMHQDVGFRRQVFRYHLETRPSFRTRFSAKMGHLPLQLTDDGSNVIQELPTHWSDGHFYELRAQGDPKAGGSTFLVIPLRGDNPIRVDPTVRAKGRSLVLDAFNLDLDAWWVMGFNVGHPTNTSSISDLLENSTDLSQGSVIMPSSGQNQQKVIHLDLEEMAAAHSHLAVRIPNRLDKTRTKVRVDMFHPEDRSAATNFAFLSNLVEASQEVVGSGTIGPSTVFYNVSFPDLKETWQAYQLRVVQSGCSKEDAGMEGIMQLITPWGLVKDSTFSMISAPSESGAKGTLRTGSIGIKLQQTRTNNVGNSELTDDGNSTPAPVTPSPPSPHVQLFLNPECSKTVIELRMDFPETCAQIIRFYWPVLPSCLVSVLLLAWAYQVRETVEGNGHATRGFVLIVSTSIMPLSVVLPGRFLSTALTFLKASWAGDFAGMMGLPAAHFLTTDYEVMAEMGTEFWMLPIVMCFVAIGTLFLLSSLAWSCVLVGGRLGGFARRMLMPRSAESHTRSGTDALSWGPVVLSAGLVALAATSCGSAALCLGCLLHFLKLMLDEGTSNASQKVNFTVAMAWLVAAIFNAPVLIMWVRSNFADEVLRFQPMERDPSFIPALCLTLCMPLLWGDLPKDSHPQHSGTISAVLQVLGHLVPVFSMVNTYRINYFICVSFILAALHRWLLNRGSNPGL